MAPVTLDASTLPRLLDPSLAHLRDVTLIPASAPSQSLHAHRFVLAAASPVFHASLSAQPLATALTLTHADADSLHASIQFVYGVSEPLERLAVHSLWTALSTCVAYALESPLAAVQRRIVDVINPNNVFFHWSMAEKYAIDSVQAQCRALVKSEFPSVAKQPEFLDVSASRLARILRIHDLAVSSEMDVFQALERWFAFDVDGRAEQALQLLRLVRLPTMSDRVLLRVCRSPFFGGHNEFYQLLLEALIRRTEVRIVHAPHVAAIVRRVAPTSSRPRPSESLKGGSDGDEFSGATYGPENAADAGSGSMELTAALVPFRPMGITDDCLLPSSVSETVSDDPSEKVRLIDDNGTSGITRREKVDLNRKEDRTILFEGAFPLRWYKSVRFRPRSSRSLVFTVVVPKWSTCRRRFISESRSFRDHKWSLWVDPFATDLSRGARDNRDPTFTPEPALSDEGVKHLGYDEKEGARIVESNENNFDRRRSSVHTSRSRAYTNGGETDYISIYLCCESELSTSQIVNARVDFSLFVASSVEDFGMERKVCMGRTFQSHGQAMGFRRHMRRSRLLDTNIGLYNREKDELIVGAHIVADR